MNAERYTLLIAPSAPRQLTDQLDDAVAFAAYEFIIGPLLDNPQRSANACDHRSPIGTAHDAARTASSTASTGRSGWSRW